MGEQLVQGCYTVASGRFNLATHRLQGTDHTATPPRPTSSAVVVTAADDYDDEIVRAKDTLVSLARCSS